MVQPLSAKSASHSEPGDHPGGYYLFPKGGPRMLVAVVREGQWIELSEGVELVVLRVDEEKVTVGINSPQDAAVCFD